MTMQDLPYLLIFLVVQILPPTLALCFFLSALELREQARNMCKCKRDT